MVCIDEDNNLQTTLYRKPTDQQPYLHDKSEYPSSLNMVLQTVKHTG